MNKDQRLEELSDLIRSGVPVDFSQAIEVIDYQERLKAAKKAERDRTLFGKLLNWMGR